MSDFDLADSKFSHRCFWPNCNELVYSSKWGCEEHWSQLPTSLQTRDLDRYKNYDTMKSLQLDREIAEWIGVNHAS